MKQPVVLRIFKDGELLGVKQFLESQIVIGRRGEVQVALDSERVSLIHASIEERGGQYFVCDLGSETGTLRNGEKVLDSKIESGDELRIGDFRIEFYIGAPKPKAAQPTSAHPSASQASAVTEAPKQAAAAPRPREQTPPSTQAKSPISEPKITTPPSAARAAASSESAAGGMESALAGPGGHRRPMAANATGTSGHKRKGKSKTFAPPSHYGSVTEFVKPTKGTVVEVLVAWRERVIGTYHFTSGKSAATITIGSHPSNDIVLPILSSRVRKLPILKVESRAIVLVSQEMTGELIRGQSTSSFGDLLRQNKMVKQGSHYVIPLDQGEMAKVEMGGQISLVVRYVSDSPKPVMAPLFDFTTAELTGIMLSLVLVATLGLYTYLYAPPKDLPDDTDNQPQRTAMIIVATPTPQALPIPPPEPKEVQTPPPPPPQVVKATPAPKPEPKASQRKAVTNLTTKNDPGRSSNAAPNKNKTGPRMVTSPKHGGAIKTAKAEGSQMQSKSKDVSHAGVFSVFGNNGAQDKLAQSTTGSGELAGLAARANGQSGSATNRAGEGLGSELKDTGMGGNGKSLNGINGGVGTTGRGSGNSGYGTGGLGNHAGTKIVTGGADESFSGTIDKEAIRRVILANYNTIRTCYERQLNRNPDLFGKIMIRWELGEQGRVVTAGVKSNELGGKGAAEVANCIVSHLKTWKFPEPPPGQQVEVIYPFFFSN